MHNCFIRVGAVFPVIQAWGRVRAAVTVAEVAAVLVKVSGSIVGCGKETKNKEVVEVAAS